jgi:hypothetical protein
MKIYFSVFTFHFLFLFPSGCEEKEHLKTELNDPSYNHLFSLSSTTSPLVLLYLNKKFEEFLFWNFFTLLSFTDNV